MRATFSKLLHSTSFALCNISFAGRRRSHSNSADSLASDVECVVIGAGVVGLACARALALAGREVLILEAAPDFGTETSARHSEVIHAGLYYPANSLKARLCVEGKQLLYEYCAAKGIAQQRITKLVVATEPGQAPDLRALQAKAAANGVPDLQLLSAQEATSLEPNLVCTAALLSPSTGILDSHTYMTALLADAEAHGATLACCSRVLAGRVTFTSSWQGEAVASAALPSMSAATCSGGAVGTSQQSPMHSSTGSASSSTTRTASPSKAAATTSTAPRAAHAQRPGITLEVEDTVGRERMTLRARHVVNAAGLEAQRVSRAILGVPAASVPHQFLARGVYFTLAATAGRPFSRLIYPLPPRAGGGLGTHLTLDLAGATRFGPDVEWISRVDYTVDPRRAASFYPAIRAFWPGLPDSALLPGYAGVRPKLSGPGQPAADFAVHGVKEHGVEGFVALYGIESPGLTSSLALGQLVKRMLLDSE